MNSLISWIGGKKLLRNKILEMFPESESYNRYIEVFGGAGWVLFSKECHAKFEVYNDTNGNLVNLFRCVKYHPTALQTELEYTLMSREQFFDAKSQIETRGMTDIQRAARFLVVIKESYGADIRTFGVKPTNMENTIEYISKVSDRLKNVVVENQDFERIFKTYDRVDALFYADPPYYESESYYQCKFTLEDHIRLKESLKRLKGRFVLSYNDCEYIREMYSDYSIVEVDRQRNLVKNMQNCRYKELLIKNY